MDLNIVIFGEIGSGKDTVSQLLTKHIDAEIVKLGSKIRNDVDELAKFSSRGKNKRQLYQEYGQSMREIFGIDIWNVYLYHSIKEGISQGKSYIISDARQPNEFSFWANLGFVPVAVVADRGIRRKRVIERDGFDQLKNFDHETEASVRKVIEIIKHLEDSGKGFVIQNNGTLEQLEEAVNNLATKLKNDFPVGS